MSDEPRVPPLEELLDLVVELAVDRIRGSEIGVVTGYDATTQVVTVQPVIKRATLNEAGERQPRLTTPVEAILAWFPRGGGSGLTFPIKRGDYGILLYSSVAIDLWKHVGGLVDPRDDRRHDLQDAVFIPGMHDLGHVPTSAPADAVVLHAAAGVEVRLASSSASEKSVLGSTYRTAEDELFGVLKTTATALVTYATAIKPIADPSNAATPDLLTALGDLVAAVTAFTLGASSYLSEKVKLQ